MKTQIQNVIPSDRMHKSLIIITALLLHDFLFWLRSSYIRCMYYLTSGVRGAPSAKLVGYRTAYSVRMYLYVCIIRIFDGFVSFSISD